MNVFVFFHVYRMYFSRLYSNMSFRVCLFVPKVLEAMNDKTLPLYRMEDDNILKLIVVPI